MEIRLFHALWGMEGSYAELLERAAGEGYDGIEAPLPAKERETEFKELLDRHRLSYIAQVATSGDHAASFEFQVLRAASFNPLLIVSHSARDAMPWEEQLRFFEHALSVERSVGIPVGHETHRSRAMFTPWTTANLLRELPDLRLTADFSHWCCVTESMLEQHQEELELSFKHTIHVHARVGHVQGPQVPHPAAPEYAHELETCKGWWSRVLLEREKDQAEFASFTPEFGPPGYMPTLPFTGQPVSDLRDVNAWMAAWLRRHFLRKA